MPSAFHAAGENKHCDVHSVCANTASGCNVNTGQKGKRSEMASVPQGTFAVVEACRIDALKKWTFQEWDDRIH